MPIYFSKNARAELGLLTLSTLCSNSNLGHNFIDLTYRLINDNGLDVTKLRFITLPIKDYKKILPGNQKNMVYFVL